MNASPALAALALLCTLCLPAGAIEANEAPSGVQSEPKVQLSVVEDDGARIEELRVRGQTQRITVQPKGAIKQPYEILPAEGGRDMSQNAGSGRGAAGQRVWRVLGF
jgi:hypothetical protein